MGALLAHRGSHSQSVEGARAGVVRWDSHQAPIAEGHGRSFCVLDGRLLNRDELLRELDLESVGTSDEQVVLEAFQRHGPAAFAKLDGPLAIALWDGETLHLVRDAIGERPLYFARIGRSVVFASESKALLAHPDFEPRADLEALLRILVFSFVPGRKTALEGVQQVEPGCRVAAPPEAEAQVTRYWDLNEAVRDEPDEVFVREVQGLLRAAVQRRLPASPQRIGAFLSGGIDSSAVVALLADMGHSPICYSAGFGFGQPNELMFASLVATHCGLEHRVIDVAPEGFIHLLPEIMWRLDDPLCDCITVPNYILAQRAAQEVDTIFNGEGGDPLFGGPKNKFMILGEWYSFLGGYDRSRAYLASYHKYYEYLNDACTPEFLTKSGGDEGLRAEVSSSLSDNGHQSFLNRLMHVNIRLKGGQNILVKVDKMLAPSGLQPCSPLFDRRLTEHSFTLPAHLKRRGDVEKYVFKKAVEDLLPRPVVYRKKAGMGVPLNHWFKKTRLRQFTRELLRSKRSVERNLFQRSFVETLLAGDLPAGHLGRDRSGELLWMLLAIELWHRVFIDGERPC